ncbi:MAG: TIGR02266 family protein, partial [Myxococcota bacterium]
MSDESKRQQQRVEVGLKVNLKYPDRESFVERFSINVSRNGLFVRAKDPLPVGSRVRFEYRLDDNTRILRGVGLVRWVRDAENSTDEKPPGMGIEFVDLDPQSEELVTHIVSTKGEGVRAPKRTESKTSEATPVRKPRRSSLPEVGNTGGEDTALDAIDALGELGGFGDDDPADSEPTPNEGTPEPETVEASAESLEEAFETELPPPVSAVQSAGDVPLVSDPLEEDPASPETNSRVDLAADRLVMDLGGTDLLTALVARDGATVDRFNEHNVQVRVGADGSLVNGEDGLWLPSLLAWYEPRGAAPRARAMASRLDWELSHDGSDLSVVIDGFPVLLRDVLFETLQEATRPHREQRSEIAETICVLPAATSSSTRVLLTKMLTELGVSEPRLMSDAEAVLASVGLELSFGVQALVVQISLFETRVTLLEGPAQVRGFRSAIDAGLWEGDDVLARHAGIAMLREHGIDDADDPSLTASLRDQVQRLRRQHVGDGPWSLSLAGATVEATPERVGEWCRPLSERIALLTHGVLNEHEVEGDDLEALVLVTDEMPWPGLIETIEDMLGLSPILPDAG